MKGQGGLAQKPLCQDSGRNEGIEPPLWQKYEIEGEAGGYFCTLQRRFSKINGYSRLLSQS